MSGKLVSAPSRRRWFNRRFELGLPREALVRRAGDAWSIQENVGHLWDLEALWAGRLEEFLGGADRLRPADLENRKTHDAKHNDGTIERLLAGFRRERMATVERLESLAPAELDRMAIHPRLGQPMSVTDHDDHHLAAISELVRAQRPGGKT